MRHLRVLAALCCLSAPVTAQRVQDLPTGTTVRVWRGTPTIAVVRGTLLSADTMEVVVGSDRTAIERLPYHELTRVEFLASRRTKDQAMGRGMLYGGSVGLGATTVLLMTAVVLGKPEKKICEPQCSGTQYGQAVSTGLAITAVTTVIGAVIGRQHTERWRRVRLPWS